MNWIVASFLMFVSSIVFYLVIKKAQVNGIHKKYYMVTNFTIPLVIFYAIVVVQHRTIFINPATIGIMVALSFVTNYLASIASYKAMELAPNAGYSLVMQKSYAIYTLPLAVILFQSSFSLYKYLIVLGILVCAAIVCIPDASLKRTHDSRWILYSLFAFFCFGANGMFGKYFVLQGIPIAVIQFWGMLSVAVLAILDLVWSHKKIKFPVSPTNILLVLGVGISVTFFFYFKLLAEVIAPNIGYVNAINAGANAVYTVIVAWIFKDHLSPKKFFAVLGITAGIILIVI